MFYLKGNLRYCIIPNTEHIKYTMHVIYEWQLASVHSTYELSEISFQVLAERAMLWRKALR